MNVKTIALIGFGEVGWQTQDDGTYVVSQPSGAMNWYPVNNHPLDKATYTFRITVAPEYQVAANGLLTDITADGQDTAGVGIAITDSTDVTLTDISTTGNGSTIATNDPTDGMKFSRNAKSPNTRARSIRSTASDTPTPIPVPAETTILVTM